MPSRIRAPRPPFPGFNTGFASRVQTYVRARVSERTSERLHRVRPLSGAYPPPYDESFHKGEGVLYLRVEKEEKNVKRDRALVDCQWTFAIGIETVLNLV